LSTLESVFPIPCLLLLLQVLEPDILR